MEKLNTVDEKPTETESERIEREQAQLRAREFYASQDRIAYSVSAPKRSPYFDDVGLGIEEQLTFFGMESETNGAG